uniref:Chromosome 9 open reading frame 153 n=1 Tax=Bos mutus grunniens TaxID=30521 RepID=A0A8B9WK09_BOSMU
MSFNRDMDPSKEGEEDESLTCSLPELYAFAENFNKENKKLNLLKMHCISPGEAQRMLSQKHFLNGTGGTDGRADDSLPVFTCKVVRREERPESMTELLHRSLLTRSLSPVERLSKSQQRISEYGIPPPVHTFPYEILIDHSKSVSMVTIRKKIQSTKILCRLGIPCVSPEKFIFEDKAPKYFLIDPAKQFMDLRDLEWKFYKGLVKWKRCISDEFSDIKNDSEKRFVGSQQLPHPLSPPLVHKSLVIYPKVDYPRYHLLKNI